jgi:hypothetical protein
MSTINDLDETVWSESTPNRHRYLPRTVPDHRCREKNQRAPDADPNLVPVAEPLNGSESGATRRAASKKTNAPAKTGGERQEKPSGDAFSARNCLNRKNDYSARHYKTDANAQTGDCGNNSTRR